MYHTPSILTLIFRFVPGAHRVPLTLVTFLGTSCRIPDFVFWSWTLHSAHCPVLYTHSIVTFMFECAPACHDRNGHLCRSVNDRITDTLHTQDAGEVRQHHQPVQPFYRRDAWHLCRRCPTVYGASAERLYSAFGCRSSNCSWTTATLVEQSLT